MNTEYNEWYWKVYRWIIWDLKHFPSDVKYAKELVMSIGEREKVAAQDPRYNPYAVAGGVAAAGAVGYGGYKA